MSLPEVPATASTAAPATVETGWTGPAALSRARWLGVLGSVLLAVGAVGSGVLPRPYGLRGVPGASVLAEQPWTVVCVALAVIGMACMVLAWFSVHTQFTLGVFTSRGASVSVRRRDSVTSRWVAVTSVLWSLPLALAPPLFSRDVYSYAAQGDLLVHGLDPYEVGPAALPSQWLESTSPTWYDTPAPYGPLFLQVARAAVALSGGQLGVAIVLLRLAAIVGVVLIAVYGARLARACGLEAGPSLWLAVGSPLLLAHFVSGSHNDALMVGLLIAGLAYAVERRPVWAAILLGLAAAVKAPALVAVPFAIVLVSSRYSGRWRLVSASAAVGSVVVAVFAALTLVTGLGAGWVLSAVKTPGTSIQWTSIPTGLGMAVGWLADLVGFDGADTAAIAVFRMAGTIATAVILVVIWWRVRRDATNPVRVLTACGCALLTVVVLAPAFHPWYLLWAVVPLALTTTDTRIRTAILIISGMLCFLVLPDGYNLSRITVVPGVIMDVAVTIGGILLGLRWWRARFRSHDPSRAGGQYPAA